MQASVAETLLLPDRRWSPQPGASEHELATLVNAAPFELPTEYIDLLRFSNGGDGELHAMPLLFVLDPVAVTLEDNLWNRSELECVDYWFFGGNGGLESIAFDLHAGPPLPIVAIDRIAGGSSAKQIANDMADFISKIGVTRFAEPDDT